MDVQSHAPPILGAELADAGRELAWRTALARNAGRARQVPRQGTGATTPGGSPLGAGGSSKRWGSGAPAVGRGACGGGPRNSRCDSPPLSYDVEGWLHRVCPMRRAASMRSSSTACEYRCAVAISVQPMMAMVVRRSTPCMRSKVAAVCLASCRRTSRTPADFSRCFHSRRSRAGSMGRPISSGKRRSSSALHREPIARRSCDWVSGVDAVRGSRVLAMRWFSWRLRSSVRPDGSRRCGAAGIGSPTVAATCRLAEFLRAGAAHGSVGSRAPRCAVERNGGSAACRRPSRRRTSGCREPRPGEGPETGPRTSGHCCDGFRRLEDVAALVPGQRLDLNDWDAGGLATRAGFEVSRLRRSASLRAERRTRCTAWTT